MCSQNSIRHNLSLHSRFEKIQNEGTGKSSWWQINHNASRTTGKSRRRATSMETPKFEKRRGRVKKVVEAIRNGLQPENTPSPSSSISESSDMIPVSPLRGFQFRLVYFSVNYVLHIMCLVLDSERLGHLCLLENELKRVKLNPSNRIFVKRRFCYRTERVYVFESTRSVLAFLLWISTIVIPQQQFCATLFSCMLLLPVRDIIVNAI